MQKLAKLTIYTLLLQLYITGAAWAANWLVDPLMRSMPIGPAATHSTLGAALADGNVHNGDTIFLRNEVFDQPYDFGGPYTISKELTIRMDPFYCPPTAMPIVHGLTITASNVTIGYNGPIDPPSGLEITNPGSSGNLVNILGGSYALIQNSTLHTINGHGIYAANASRFGITGNAIWGIGSDGIHLQNCTEPLITNNAIGKANNGIYRNIVGNGIYLEGCEAPFLKLNIISYCLGDRGAIYIGPYVGSGKTNSKSVRVVMNYIIDNFTANGILVESAEVIDERQPNTIASNFIGNNVYTPPVFNLPDCSGAEVYHGNSITVYKPVGKTIVSSNSVRQNLADVSNYTCATAPASGGHPASGIYIYKNPNLVIEPEIFLKNNLITMYWDTSAPDPANYYWRCWDPDPPQNDPVACPPDGECCAAITTYDGAIAGNTEPTQETYADYNFIGGPENVVVSWTIVKNSPLRKFFLSQVGPYLDLDGNNWQVRCDFPEPENDPADSGGHGGSCGAQETNCVVHVGFMRQEPLDGSGIDVNMDYSQYDTETGYLTQQFTLTNNLTDAQGEPVTMYNPKVVSPFVWYDDQTPNPWNIISENYIFANPLPYQFGGYFMDSVNNWLVAAIDPAGTNFDWHTYFQLTSPFCTDEGYRNLADQCTAAGKHYPWWGLNNDNTKLNYGASTSFIQTFYPVGWTMGADWWMMNFNYIAYDTQPSPLTYHWDFSNGTGIWGPDGTLTDCGNLKGSGEFMELPDYTLPYPANTNNTWTAASGKLEKENPTDKFGEILSLTGRYLDILALDPNTGDPRYYDGGLISKVYGLAGNIPGVNDSYAKLQARVYTVNNTQELFTLFDTRFFYDNLQCEPYDLYDPDPAACPRFRNTATPLPFNVWEYFSYGEDFESNNYMTIDLFKVICEGLYEGKRVNRLDIKDLSLEFVVHRVDGDEVTKLCIDEMKLSDETANLMKLEPSLILPPNEWQFPEPDPGNTTRPITFRWQALADENYNPQLWLDEIFYHLFLERCQDSACSDPLNQVLYSRYIYVNDPFYTGNPYVFGTDEEVTLDLIPGRYQWKIVALDNHGYGNATPIKYFTIEGQDLIELATFKAVPGNQKVTLQWRTESELDNAGFNIYRSRSEEGPYTKVNKALIPASDSGVSGATYEYVDEGVRNGLIYYYRLEDLDLNGISTTHDPVKARPLRLYAFTKRSRR